MNVSAAEDFTLSNLCNIFSIVFLKVDVTTNVRLTLWGTKTDGICLTSLGKVGMIQFQQAVSCDLKNFNFIKFDYFQI